MTTLTTRDLNRAFLARQHLLERAPMTSLDLLRQLVGMQSQAPLAPYVGLWSRLRDFDPAELGRAMENREAVRIVLMRSTIHLVAADDAHGLRAVHDDMLAHRFTTSIHAKALPGVDPRAVAREGEQLVTDESMTFAALGKALAVHHDGKPEPLAQAVRNHVPLVQVPPRGVWGKGGLGRHLTLDAWIGKPAGPSPSIDDVVRRYLAAYGPATVQDVQAWSGIPRLAPVLHRLAPDLLTFISETGATLHDLPDAPRPPAETPAPVRFLPEYDNLLLSHADRTRVWPAEHKDALHSANGVVPGTVLVDGMLAATWRRDRKTHALDVTELRPFTKGERADVSAEASRLTDWFRQHS